MQGQSWAAVERALLRLPSSFQGLTHLGGARQVLPAPPRHWVGNGFHVYPVFHDKAFTAEVSPWLMFDYGAPKEFGPTTSRRGVGQHPHRGFETVTIAFQGEVGTAYPHASGLMLST